MTRVVPVYQCFFFAAVRIGYWENIDSDSDGAIEALLSQRLAAENWEAAEGWVQGNLICRIVAPAVSSENAPRQPECGSHGDSE
jgi:hypothetical protein